MIAAKCKRCGYIGCNSDNSLCNDKGDIKKYLEIDFILEDKFVYKSKKKRLGLGAGDDSILYIYSDEYNTHIWWKENKGFEKTIFEGRGMKSIKDFEKVFDLLDIKW